MTQPDSLGLLLSNLGVLSVAALAYFIFWLLGVKGFHHATLSHRFEQHLFADHWDVLPVGWLDEEERLANLAKHPGKAAKAGKIAIEKPIVWRDGLCGVAEILWDHVYTCQLDYDGVELVEEEDTLEDGYLAVKFGDLVVLFGLSQ